MKRLASRSLLQFLVAVTAALLVACAGMQKPVTAQDYVQSAKAQVTAVYKSIGDLKATASITSAEGQGYLAKADTAARQVAVVQQLADGGADLTTVQGALNTTLTGLLLLQSELNAKQKGK